MAFLPRHRPSPAMVVGVVALFVALSGASFAAVSATIGSTQIIDNSVLSRDIHDNTLRSVDIADGTVGANDLAAGLLPWGYSTFKDSFQLTTAANALVPVARLDLPAGAYVIFAKLFTGVPVALGGFAESVKCELVAGGDFDQGFATHDAVTPYTSISLNVAHQFSAAGTAALNCGHVFTNGKTTLGFVKISAVRVATLSNVASP